MSIPDKAATQNDDKSSAARKEPVTFEAKINTLVNDLTRDEKGKYIIPENLSEAEKYAVSAERRRRDTQAEYTKTTQETKALKAEKAELLKRVNQNVKIEMTAEQAEELESLKFEDPEAYRLKMNKYEQTALAKQDEELTESLKQVSASTLETEELEQRDITLAKFNQAHPDFVLTNEVFDNDIPPRIVKKLETGKISFEAFLKECYDYTKTGKVVKQEALPGKQPNLGNVGGSSKPDGNAVKEDIILSYNTETY